ncbi:hypothetical protein BX600DRAFT_114829 [Xylariales sp. PMI_506]|nr:hypothetical protein BX600DRAFT_114829 [Xylariales sp. PMI_506]
MLEPIAAHYPCSGTQQTRRFGSAVHAPRSLFVPRRGFGYSTGTRTHTLSHSHRIGSRSCLQVWVLVTGFVALPAGSHASRLPKSSPTFTSYGRDDARNCCNTITKLLHKRAGRKRRDNEICEIRLQTVTVEQSSIDRTPLSLLRDLSSYSNTYTSSILSNKRPLENSQTPPHI